MFRPVTGLGRLVILTHYTNLILVRTRCFQDALHFVDKLVLLLQKRLLIVHLASIVDRAREVAQAGNLEQVQQLALVIRARLTTFFYLDHRVLLITSGLCML